jgi:hypothetical protein
MDQRYEVDELDQDTLDYLKRVAKRWGRGFPGVYLDAKEAGLWGPTLPIWGAICGPIIILITLLCSWGSLHEPTGVAMFMTGGLLLGGWMFFAWVRCLIARTRENYIGHFKYIDSLYLWHGEGTGVNVTPTGMLMRADCQHNYDENENYKNSTVRIQLADRRLEISVTSQGCADRLEEYLNNLAEIREGTPAERGYLALERTTDYDEEEDEDSKRIVKAIPDPQKERTSVNWLPMIVLPVTILVLFFVCKLLATALRDDAIFDIVKNRPAGDLRFYLLDSRNTRHRKEVSAKLQQMHEGIAQRVAGQGDPNLGAGLADLVRALSGEARPVLTLGFTKQEKKADTPEAFLSPALLETINREMIKDISTRLSQHLDQQTTDYAEVTEGGAMIEFTPRVIVPPKGGARREARIDWTVTLQATPEGKKHTTTLTSTMVQSSDDPVPTVRALYRQLAHAFNQRLTQR